MELFRQTRASQTITANKTHSTEYGNEKGIARFHVPVAVLLKHQVFWNFTPCRLVNGYWRLQGLCLPSSSL